MMGFQQYLNDTLGREYTFERELPGGAMSRVFIAIGRTTSRKLVIKFLSRELIDELDRSHFRHEMLAATQLEHPHVLHCVSTGEHKDLLWYAMPFIAGQSLRSVIARRRPMPVADVLRVLSHVAEALDYAHGEGIVHRDLNPANILQSGTHTLVTDFGVAKALVASVPESAVTRIGTPAYMAPEQLAGDSAADHRVDIYAVGLLANELLTGGKSRFAETAPSTTRPAGWSQEPEPLLDPVDIPQSLSELITRCLSRDPDDRPATARELLNALDEISIADAAVQAPPETTIEPTIEAMAEPAPEPALEPVSLPPEEPTPEQTAASQTPLFGLAPPLWDGKKILAGGLVLILPIVAGAILLSRRSGTAASGDTVSPAAVSSAAVPAAIESAPPDTSPHEVETPKKVSARQRTSRSRADSIQKARAEWAKLAAQQDSLRAESARRSAALSDSLRRVEETMRSRVRSAAAALLANPRALNSFMEGATHKGGLLGNRTKGDLQTQIDALQPFLIESGLSYQQFKDIVKASGITLFDKFGRMMPDSLQRVAGTTR